MTLTKEQKYGLKLVTMLIENSLKMKRCGRYRDALYDMSKALQDGNIDQTIRRDKSRVGTILGRLEKTRKKSRRRKNGNGNT